MTGDKSEAIAANGSSVDATEGHARDGMRATHSVNTYGSSWELPPSLDEAISVEMIWHSLRRSWARALLVGSALAIASALGVWFFVPVEYEASALLHVKSREERILPSIAGRERPFSPQDYDIFRQTQSALIKSPYVLHATLRDTRVQRLSLLTRTAEPEAWLEENIVATYPNNAELLRISLTADQPRQIIEIVNAVKRAYLEEVVHARRKELSDRVEELRRRHVRARDELHGLREDVHRLATQVGTEDSMQARVRQRLELEKLAAMSSERSNLAGRVSDVELKIALVETGIAHQVEYRVSPEDVELELLQDFAYLQKKQQVDQQQATHSQLMLVALVESASAQRSANRLTILEGELRTIRDQLEPKITEKLRAQRGQNNDAATTLEMLRRERELLNERLTKSTKSHEEQLAFVQQLDDFNATLEIKRQDLQQVLASDAALKQEINDLEVQLASPPRIVSIQDASTAKSTNGLLKYLQMAVVMLASFGIIGAAFVAIDLQSQPISVASDVTQHCGLRIVGQLPKLASRRREPAGRSMAAAADVVRAALLFPRRSLARGQVFLITSAQGGEGKTTLASQLACSLARAGKQTLLIDADLRSPRQHEIFGLPAQPGLGELLQGEGSSFEPIRATQIANLSLLAAGHGETAAGHEELAEHLVQRLREKFSAIVIDAPPTLLGSDPLLWGHLADVTLLSVRRDVSKMAKVREARERLLGVGVPVTGAVLQGMPLEGRRVTKVATSPTRAGVVG